MRYIAEKAGVRLNNHRGPDFHRELAARKAEQRRIEETAGELQTLERDLRLATCRRIQVAERNKVRATERLRILGPETIGSEVATLWKELKSAAAWLGTDLAAYSLLSFGSVGERSKFVLKAELRREMISDIRWHG